MYTYFLSSVRAGLEKERNEAIRAINDLQNKCEAMENFIISSGNFDEVLRTIDRCDKVILLIGDSYGSVDSKTGKSYTQMEIEYAKSIGKNICSLKLPSFTRLEKRYKSGEKLTEDQIKHCEFVNSMEYIYSVGKEYTVYRAVCVYHMGQLAQDESRWRKKNLRYDLGGKWYSVHVSDFEKSYLRLGEITINQDYSSSQYRELNVEGDNYNLIKDGNGPAHSPDGMILVDETRKSNTRWRADYEIYVNAGKIMGIFVANRGFVSTFENGIEGKNQQQYGIHELNFGKTDPDGRTIELWGTFRNAADPERLKPDASNHKAGYLTLFRDRLKRDKYVEDLIERGVVKL